ncbi:agmatine deiminase [Sphingorhabdus lutea]|uniref:Agmatine deiminase n=2 Tax=Sphingorhabdus lutea TaxID=1913578 RepID=A0A1L3JF10_9SPHN|nr:agmatine deiminase [Sphingorhabdus lutea]
METNLMPAEWAMHQAVWIGFPWNSAEWPTDMDKAQQQIAAFANAVHCGGAGEHVILVAGDQSSYDRAISLVDDGVEVCLEKIGDIWLRDTAAIITGSGANRRAKNFDFNGWGGSYLMDGDQEIGDTLALAQKFPIDKCNWILEGGAIDVDGSGWAVTTMDCLLNPNRNPALSQADIAQKLNEDLGINNIIWLGDGLRNDHTDGHVDNLARFIRAGHLLLPQSSPDDPNFYIYEAAFAEASKHDVQISRICSPGAYLVDGEAIPASYMNFYIGNKVVVMPAYGTKYDDEAAKTLGMHFPNHKIAALPATAVILGGGSFHCASQQIPA